MRKPLRIGTRASPLALAQTELFIKELQVKNPGFRENGALEIVRITTSGDRIQDRPLYDVGGKGLFTKEIEEALLNGHIDCAVHSMKDMPPVLPEGLVIECFLKREDPRDAFFSKTAISISELPAGAIVGTSSLRRQAFILSKRPDLKTVPLRGNVGTRIEKLEKGIVDATLLALAGLKRLGLSHLAKGILSEEEMLPAAGQGAIGIQTRKNDELLSSLLADVHCETTALRVTAERAFLAVMEGSCRTPLAALMGELDPQQRVRFSAAVARPDGKDFRKVSYVAVIRSLHDARQLGEKAAYEIKKDLPENFMH